MFAKPKIRKLKQHKEYINRKRSITLRTTIISFLMCFFVFGSIIYVQAADGTFQLPSFLNRYDVYRGTDDYTPNTDEYPFNLKATKVSFGKLYGSNKSFFEYMGEIPDKIKDEDWAKKYRTYGSDKINGATRKWGQTEYGEDDIKVDSDDIHITSMTVKHSALGFSFGSIIFAIVSAVNWLFEMLVNLMITFKSFNLGTIVSSIDPSGDLCKNLSSIFLINPDTHTLSPFLLFGLAAFVVTFVVVGFKAIRGRASFRSVVNEVGFFLLAVIVAAIFLTTTNPTTLSNIGVDALNKLSNDIASSASGSCKIFTFSTDNTSLDNTETQRALINKVYIDQVINGQFGTPVSGLYLVRDDGTAGDFGSLELVGSAMEETFGINNAEGLGLIVSTDGTAKINNLGYTLWACNSNVSVITPAVYNSSSTGNLSLVNTPFYVDGDTTKVYSKANPDRVLYVVDFLNALKSKAIDAGDNETVNKVDGIIKNFDSPDYWTATANVFAVQFNNLALAYALLMITIFCVIGQIIVILGSFAMVVLPTLLLFDKTRDVAKRMAFTYLMGFLRYLIGTALFNTVIIISVLLCQSGFMGILVSILVCFLMGKFGPQLIRIINESLTQLGRGRELRGMSSLYGKMNNGMDRFSSGRRRERMRRWRQERRRRKSENKEDQATEGRDKTERATTGTQADGQPSRRRDRTRVDNDDESQELLTNETTNPEGDQSSGSETNGNGDSANTNNSTNGESADRNSDSSDETRSRNLIGENGPIENEDSITPQRAQTGLGESVVEDVDLDKGSDNEDDISLDTSGDGQKSRDLLGDNHDYNDSDNEDEFEVEDHAAVSGSQKLWDDINDPNHIMTDNEAEQIHNLYPEYDKNFIKEIHGKFQKAKEEGKPVAEQDFEEFIADGQPIRSKRGVDAKFNTVSKNSSNGEKEAKPLFKPLIEKKKKPEKSESKYEPKSFDIVEDPTITPGPSMKRSTGKPAPASNKPIETPVIDNSPYKGNSQKKISKPTRDNMQQTKHLAVEQRSNGSDKHVKAPASVQDQWNAGQPKQQLKSGKKNTKATTNARTDSTIAATQAAETKEQIARVKKQPQDKVATDIARAKENRGKKFDSKKDSINPDSNSSKQKHSLFGRKDKTINGSETSNTNSDNSDKKRSSEGKFFKGKKKGGSVPKSSFKKSEKDSLMSEISKIVASSDSSITLDEAYQRAVEKLGGSSSQKMTFEDIRNSMSQTDVESIKSMAEDMKANPNKYQ